MSTPYDINLGPVPQRVLGTLAEHRQQRSPDHVGAIAHVPNLLVDAVAIGLATLGDRELAPNTLKLEARQWLRDQLPS